METSPPEAAEPGQNDERTSPTLSRSGAGEDAEEALESQADELEERVAKLGDDIDDAKEGLRARKEDADDGDDDGGDGDDPLAFDDPEADEDDDERRGRATSATSVRRGLAGSRRIAPRAKRRTASGSSSCSSGLQARVDRGRVGRARELDRALQHDRAGVDALVDEVHGHAEDLHAVGRPPARSTRCRGRPAAATDGR